MIILKEVIKKENKKLYKTEITYTNEHYIDLNDTLLEKIILENITGVNFENIDEKSILPDILILNLKPSYLLLTNSLYSKYIEIKYDIATQFLTFRIFYKLEDKKNTTYFCLTIPSKNSDILIDNFTNIISFFYNLNIKQNESAIISINNINFNVRYELDYIFKETIENIKLKYINSNGTITIVNAETHTKFIIHIYEDIKYIIIYYKNNSIIIYKDITTISNINNNDNLEEIISIITQDKLYKLKLEEINRLTKFFINNIEKNLPK